MVTTLRDPDTESLVLVTSVWIAPEKDFSEESHGLINPLAHA
ncbi:MAG: hypothetical protein WCH65_06140 [bacterium]